MEDLCLLLRDASYMKMLHLKEYHTNKLNWQHSCPKWLTLSFYLGLKVQCVIFRRILLLLLL